MARPTSCPSPSSRRLAPLAFAAVLASGVPVWAHVKWFSSRFSFSDPPRGWAEIVTPTFWAIAALSLVTVALLVLADGPLSRLRGYRAVEAWFDVRKAAAFNVMRVTAGIVLLLCWQGNVLLAHELHYTSEWIGWLQLALVFCLFGRRTTSVAGAGILLLYAIAIGQYGLLHMLDYFAFVGVGYYLLAHDLPTQQLARFAKPALFAATGLSLCWLAMEKFFYPQWSLLLLEQHPQLALGLDPTFFLVGAAFLEFCLGYLLIVGLWGRPLAIVITLVFFLTTLVFGKDEVIGHAVLHGILIVFMLEGAEGALRPPIKLHERLPLRLAFGVVNLAAAFVAVAMPYRSLAVSRQVAAVTASAGAAAGCPMHGGMNTVLLEVVGADAPSVSLQASEKETGGWRLDVQLRGLTLAPENAGALHRPGEGHVHLYVDGRVHGQLFTRQADLPPLGPGAHTLTAELGTNDHRIYARDGQPIRAVLVVSTTVDPAGPPPSRAPVDTEFTADDLVFFAPLPERMDGAGKPSPALVDLGRMLYFEPRLSKTAGMSCNSCHPLDRYGADRQPTSPGAEGQRGTRNTPTVYNAGLALAQFWDGRAADLEAQAKGPVLNPIEMGMPSAAGVEEALRAIPGYRAAFRAAFPQGQEPVTYDHMAQAVGAFERGLTTPGRFDRFLSGDADALTHREKEGLRTFLSLGCTSCHNGPAIGGRSYQRIGLVVPYDDARDVGREGVTQATADRQLFKVPSLRNVAETAPYFHNGELQTLPEVVRTMARHQLGKTLSELDVERLVAFLDSLTGELPADYIRAPKLPASPALRAQRLTRSPRTR